MTLPLPTKSSSRAGRFKKKLVSPEALLIEAPVMKEKLKPFYELYLTKKLSEADFTASYLLCFLSHRFPESWPGSRHKEQKAISGIDWRELPFEFEPNVMRRFEDIRSLQEIFANFALKSTPLAVNRALLSWYDGSNGLELMFRIPSPKEVLLQQKCGRRCVTALIDDRISKYILGERDALSFTMHDLVHADHFFHHNECYQGQLAFYGLLDMTFAYFDLSHEKFLSEFEYLISDMNAYAIHLLKCLKSAMVHYFDEDHFKNWPRGLNPPEELFLLNSPAYSPETMDRVLLSWLEDFRS
jgi:hypothetical protein